ncbi:hypothetical protein [Arabiibacter massiliensis]|uniref:hypothetical protein n=1 Tax=Arabiibacter massiliensis TaxID=1870985 RepID=UPI0009B9A842|nr:hypothetical protein [Arabiibacter massiliensis]
MGYREEARAAEEKILDAKIAYQSAIRDAERALKWAERDLEDIKRNHAQLVRDAERKILVLERARKRHIDDLDAKIEEANRSPRKKLGTFKGVALYADSVSGKGSKIKFDQSTRVEVDARGGEYPAGRFGVIKDCKELFLVVSSFDGCIMVEFDPKEEEAVRAFARKIEQAIVDYPSVIAERDAKICELRQERKAFVADTSTIEEAQSALAEMREDPGVLEDIAQAKLAVSVAEEALKEARVDASAIESAEKEFADLRASAPAHEVMAYEREGAKSGLIMVLIAVIVVIAIVAAIVAMVLS